MKDKLVLTSIDIDEFVNAVADAVVRKLKVSDLITIPMSSTEQAATRQQAADYLQVSLPTLDNLIKSGQLHSFNIGRQVRIKWANLENYVKNK